MRAKFIHENIRFERSGNPNKSMGIGKYQPSEVKFKNSDGEIETIEVKDNEFKLRYMNVRLEFGEADDHEIAKVYVDDQESDINLFKMEPFDYEFKKQGEYAQPGYTGYGFPIAKDEEDLKRLKDKHSYWYAGAGDYNRQSKNPFSAAAQLILTIY